MANRYWVGGTGSWSGTNTANWSTSSGGASGASVPTSADDVFFDANSGTGTATITTGGMTVKSLNCTGYTGTLAGTTNISIAGSITWGSGMVLNYSGSLTITGTGTYTSNGKTRAGTTTITGAGITVTLADAYTSTGALTLTNGTFDTAGYALTALSLNATGSSSRTILLKTSAITLTGSGTITNISGIATLTFDAGTSTITCSSASAKSLGNTAAAGNSITYYNVVSTGAGALTLINTNVFNSVTVGNTTATSINTLFTDSNQTIGTLNLNGGAPTQRVNFSSTVFETQRTITLTSFGTSIDCDFEDIAITGSAAGTSITRAGDLGGNSGIGFPAAKTVYWNLAGTNGFAANGWATSSGGTPAVNNFPLAQDTAVVDNNSAGTGWTSYASVFTFGTLDMSARTSAFNINFAAGSVQFTGSFKGGTGNTYSTVASQSLTFIGSGSSILQSSGKAINHDITIACRTGGTVALADALTLSSASTGLSVDSGSFDTAGYAISVGTVSSIGNLTRAIILGTSTLTVTGATFNLGSTGLTFSGTSSTIIFPTNTTITFTGGGHSYGTVSITGSGTQTFTIVNSNTFTTLSNGRTVAYSILFTGGTTQTFTNFNVSGSSGALVTIGSTNTTQVTLRKPSAWNVGANSVDGGNNIGLSFTGTNPDYLSISRITGVNTAPSVLATGNFLVFF